MLPIKIKLPSGFLDEEVRDGYLIKPEIKQVWAVELDLLNEFMNVCKKYNIKFFADAGTILGAVRHGGFIPWDDDVDVALFRDDYEKLCKIAPKEFTAPYFFQTEYTDPGSFRGHAQLRNSKTTGILKHEYNNRYSFNQGIFIDIFPLDNIIDDDDKFTQQCKSLAQIKEAFNERRIYIENILKHPRRNFIAKFFNQSRSYIYKYIFREKYGYEGLYRLYEKEATKYSNVDCKCIGHVIFSPFISRFKWNKNAFNSIKWVKFENLEIPIPYDYDSVLTTSYGDWRKFVVGTSVHGGVIFEPSMSYVDFFIKNYVSTVR